MGGLSIFRVLELIDTVLGPILVNEPILGLFLGLVDKLEEIGHFFFLRVFRCFLTLFLLRVLDVDRIMIQVDDFGHQPLEHHTFDQHARSRVIL